MHARELPRRPDLVQYKKQAKELVRLFRAGDQDFLQFGRLLKLIQQVHPKHKTKSEAEIRGAVFALSDAQLVLAREHGFASWPVFARAVEAARGGELVEVREDADAAFLRAACVPVNGDGHGSGNLEAAEAILKAHPEVAGASIYVAAALGDAEGVRRWLAKDAGVAEAKGGVYRWDALTYLCFSKYLRVLRQDAGRSEGFLAAARALLDAGASADTGWFQANDELMPFWESVIYGAAGVARHSEMTRLLLERGADPNDEETAYHAAEGYDLTVLRVLLESGKLNAESMTTLLVRKADWHDAAGIRMVLEFGGNAHLETRWRVSGLMAAVRRDNELENVALMLGIAPNMGDEAVRASVRGAASLAAMRGRGDVLSLFAERGVLPELAGVERLLEACACGDVPGVRAIAESEPGLIRELLAVGGSVLGRFAANGNVEGIRLLLELGVDAAATDSEGDAYFDIAKGGTGLHAAAWRMRHEAVALLLERGVPVNALDAKGRSALQRAVVACVDSYWSRWRKPDSVEMLLRAGASVAGIDFPSGYAEVDGLLREYGA